MKWKGYKLSEPPMESRSDFLKNIEMLDNYNFCE